MENSGLACETGAMPADGAGVEWEAKRTAPGFEVLRGASILVAEDNSANLLLVTRLLEKHGARVTPAEDGQEAVDRWTSGAFDLILMDLQMPSVDGFEAAQRIRVLEAARGGRVPILACTASTFRGDEWRVLGAGMDGWITKPIRISSLLAAVSALIVAGSSRGANAATP